MAEALPAATLTRIGELLRVPVAELEARRLAGGLTNRSFLLTWRNQRWAVRLPDQTLAHRGNDAPAERGLLNCVSAAGLAPEAVAGDPQTGILITRYLTGALTWNEEHAREPENIRRIARRLRLLHTLRCDAQPFRPTLLAAAYLEVAGEDVGLAGEEAGWRRELCSLAADYEARFAAETLCHNDLVAANILDDGDLWLIDFEYAMCAHPILDLASLAGMNRYDAAARDALLSAYYDDAPPPFGTERLESVIRLVQLLSLFWARSCLRLDRNDALARFAARMVAVLR